MAVEPPDEDDIFRQCARQLQRELVCDEPRVSTHDVCCMHALAAIEQVWLLEIIASALSSIATDLAKAREPRVPLADALGGDTDIANAVREWARGPSKTPNN